MRWEDNFNLIHNYIEKVYPDYIRKTVVESVLSNKTFYTIGFVQFHNTCNIIFFQIDRFKMNILETANITVTKEQGNQIYKNLMNSKKINKNGDKYYTYR